MICHIFQGHYQPYYAQKNYVPTISRNVNRKQITHSYIYFLIIYLRESKIKYLFQL